MKIISVDPTTDPLWQRVLEQQSSNVFHSPQWLQVLADTYDFETCGHLLVDEMDQPYAALPFCKVSDMRGERHVTLPFSDYCDPLVDNYGQWQALLDQMINAPLPYTIRCLHNDMPLQDNRLLGVNRAKWHGIDLTPDLDTLWEKLPSSARRANRKATREGVTVRSATSQEELRIFYEMHLRVRKDKYRLLAQPYRFFERIWHHFVEEQQGALLVAEYQQSIIAATLFLRWQDTLYYKFNASQPEMLAVRPNDLMMWAGIRHAKEQGCSYLDLGLSDWDQEGLLRYKRKFATDEKTISFLRYQPEAAENPQAEGFGKLMPQLTDLFTDASVPDSVTEAAGDLLYRLFT